MSSRLCDRDILLRKPHVNDGLAIHNLIERCPPLDLNSPYAYHLLARHFNGTSVVAEFQGEVVGFLSAYLEPSDPKRLFVWQVVVDSKLRGKGLAGLMLGSLIARPVCRNITHVDATVNPGNPVSRKLFTRLAKELGVQISEEVFLTEEQLGDNGHAAELLLSVGPIQREQRATTPAAEKRYAYI